ncbi:DUF2155 domain-containing protein [Ferrovibrio sp.]|uniref:DUF2155 domain-containing protein n=1 Tax=Ferrovibrio sp. TaxID=1917215 RepID=UPI0035B322FF
MRHLLAAAFLLLASSPAFAQSGVPAQALPSNPLPIAVLQGLDKITARITTFDAALDQTVNFGRLQITVRACRKRPPEYPPENAAYLEIVEQVTGSAPVQRFQGWMFASSPALNALEHPVYDVWVIDCKAAR